jgi:hypothetical protein
MYLLPSASTGHEARLPLLPYMQAAKDGRLEAEERFGKRFSGLLGRRGGPSSY